MAACTICLRESGALHSHHTIPRSCGGEDSLQIPLCGDCHTQLHAAALNIISRINTGKTRVKPFWSNPEDSARADPYLKILVEALIKEKQNPNREFIINASVNKEVWQHLKLIQADLNLSSIEKTLEFCIQFTANSRGLNTITKEKPKLWYKQQ